MNTALAIVDIQMDYFPAGRMEVAGAEEACQAAGRLLGLFRERNLPLVHIQHISTRPGASFLLPNTKGIYFHESVKPLPGEVVIVKHFPNSFRDTGLREYLDLRGIAELVICGMMSQMCIDATARAAFDGGYACIVAHDACAARDLTFNGTDIPARHVHGAYMAALAAVYVKVLSVEEITGRLKGA